MENGKSGPSAPRPLAPSPVSLPLALSPIWLIQIDTK